MKGVSASLRTAARQRHDGEGGAILAVVVVEGEIPPVAVLFLQRQHEVGEVIFQGGRFFRRQIVHAKAGVVMAVVEKVSGDRKPGLVRHRAFASNRKPAVAVAQSVEPGDQHLVGDRLVAPVAQGDVAGLGAPEAAAGAVDAIEWAHFQILAIHVGVVTFTLAPDGGNGALDQLVRHSDPDLLCLVQGHQRGGGGEADAAGGGLFCAHPEVVITPAAIDGLVALQAVDLLVDEILYRLDFICLASGLRPLMHVNESLDAIAVGPDIVHGVGGGPPDLGQFFHQPGFAALEGLQCLG